MNQQWEGMLEPVSASSLCGEDLAYSPEFDKIMEYRREDDASIEYGEWQSDLKQADWQAVVRDCALLLRTRSKDLRLAVWLTEGLVKTGGLTGLAQGMQLSASLIERFGGQIHPQPENGDQEQRIGNISWLVMRMARLVKEIPVTRSGLGDFNLNDHESARLLEAQLQRDPSSVDEGRVTLEKFLAAAARTDKSLYVQWLEDAARCRSALGGLEQVAAALFGESGPSFGVLADSLAAVEDRLHRIARELGLLAPADPGAGEPAADAAAAAGREGIIDPVLAPGSAISTRAQALAQLRLVAEFFRRTEPHSPVAYLADKAARWGNMPLHVWLRSVLKDGGSLAHLEEILGLEGEVAN